MSQPSPPLVVVVGRLLTAIPRAATTARPGNDLRSRGNGDDDDDDNNRLPERELAANENDAAIREARDNAAVVASSRTW